MNNLNCGWVCPKCGRVMAPFVAECSYCNKETHKQFSNKPIVKDFVETEEIPVKKEINQVENSKPKPKVEMYVDDKFIKDLDLDANILMDTILKLLDNKIDK